MGSVYHEFQNTIKRDTKTCRCSVCIEGMQDESTIRSETRLLLRCKYALAIRPFILSHSHVHLRFCDRPHTVGTMRGDNLTK